MNIYRGLFSEKKIQKINEDVNTSSFLTGKGKKKKNSITGRTILFSYKER